MEVDDKLEVADPSSEEREIENLDDLFNNEEEGETNVAPAEEEGTLETMSLSELNSLAGRSGNQSFNTKDDFFKHYKNLASLVGKPAVREASAEKPKKSDSSDKVATLEEEIRTIKATLVQKDFLSRTPEAGAHLKIVEAVALKDGVSLDDAWEKSVKALAQAAGSYQKEREVGVNSKNRINPMTSQKLNSAKEKFLTSGNRSDMERLVGEALGI